MLQRLVSQERPDHLDVAKELGVLGALLAGSRIGSLRVLSTVRLGGLRRCDSIGDGRHRTVDKDPQGTY